MKFAPLIIFGFNRPLHLLRTLEAISLNAEAKETHLFAHLDGPRSEYDKANIEHTKNIFLRFQDRFSEFTLIERDVNLGLAQSAIAGVTHVLSRYDRMIFLEDDNLTSRHFLKYMNDGLNIYEAESIVSSISAYCYPIAHRFKKDTAFIRGSHSWGWATWADRWHLFNPDGKALLDDMEAKKLCYRFDYNGSFTYTKMLKNQVEKKNNSWSIRWMASTFLANTLTLFPRVSLVQNIGMDGSGEHCGETASFNVELAHQPLVLGDIAIEEDEDLYKAMVEFFSAHMMKNSRKVRVLSFLFSFVPLSMRRNIIYRICQRF